MTHRGLIARGLPVSAVRRAWRKLMYDKITVKIARKDLTAAFEDLLSKQNFSQASALEEEQKQSRHDTTMHQIHSLLINDLTADNHILLMFCKCEPLSLTFMKHTATNMSD